MLSNSPRDDRVQDLQILIGADINAVDRLGVRRLDDEDALAEVDASQNPGGGPYRQTGLLLRAEGMRGTLRIRYRVSDGRIWSVGVKDPTAAAGARLGPVALGVHLSGVRDALGATSQEAQIAFGKRAYWWADDGCLRRVDANTETTEIHAPSHPAGTCLWATVSSSALAPAGFDDGVLRAGLGLFFTTQVSIEDVRGTLSERLTLTDGQLDRYKTWNASGWERRVRVNHSTLRGIHRIALRPSQPGEPWTWIARECMPQIQGLIQRVGVVV